MKFLPVLLLFLSSMAFLKAQDDAAAVIPPMPPGPAVQLRAPIMSQWSITFDDSAGAATDSGTPPAAPVPPKKKIYFGSAFTITKTGKTIRRQTIDDQNHSWNAWCIGDVQITLYPDGKTYIVQPRPSSLNFPPLFYMDYSRTDFPDFWWVSDKNYSGIKSQDGKPCLYFKDHIKFYRDDPEATDLEAFIDLKTRYPVLFTLKTPSRLITHTYAFDAPPVNELELPEIIQSAFKQHEDGPPSTRQIPHL